MRERKTYPSVAHYAAAMAVPLREVDENEPEHRSDGGCEICGRKFKTTAGYEHHLARYHGK